MLLLVAEDILDSSYQPQILLLMTQVGVPGFRNYSIVLRLATDSLWSRLGDWPPRSQCAQVDASAALKRTVPRSWFSRRRINGNFKSGLR